MELIHKTLKVAKKQHSGFKGIKKENLNFSFTTWLQVVKHNQPIEPKTIYYRCFCKENGRVFVLKVLCKK